MELYILNTSKIGPTLLRSMHLPPPDPSSNFSTLIPRDALDSALSNAKDSLNDKGKDLADNAGDLIKDPTAAIKDLKNNITQSVDDAKKQVQDAASKAEDTLKNATGRIVSTLINETIEGFHIHDFYIAHLLTYCEGNYTAKGKENITFCSNHKPNNKYNFNTTGNATITKGDNNPLAFLESLHLPDPIEYGLKALTLLAKIISAFYIVGTITVFITLVSSALTIPLYFAPPNPFGKGGGKRTLLRWLSLASSSCAFFTLLLASTMVHFLIKKLCEMFIEHPGLGVAAYPGKTFQGCSWASVFLVGIAMTLALMDVGMGLMTRSARNKMKGQVEKRRWWGKGRREEKDMEMED